MPRHHRGDLLEYFSLVRTSLMRGPWCLIVLRSRPDDPITEPFVRFPLLICVGLADGHRRLVLLGRDVWPAAVARYQSRFATAYSELSRRRKSQAEEARRRGIFLAGIQEALPRSLTLPKRPRKLRTTRSPSKSRSSTTSAPRLATPSKTRAGKSGHLVYQYEIVPATDKSAKASRLKELNEAKRRHTGRWIGRSADGKIQKDKLHRRRAERTFHEHDGPARRTRSPARRKR